MSAHLAQIVDQIIQTHLARLQNGQETLDDLLAQYPDVADDLRPQIEAALWLQAHKDSLEPRPGFLLATKKRLVTQIQQNTAAQEPAKTGFSLRSILDLWQLKLSLQLATLTLLVLTLITFGKAVSLASQLALPGDALYPLKLTSEVFQLALTSGDAEDAALYIEFSERRTAEIVELYLDGRYDDIPQTADRLETQVGHARRLLAALTATEAGQASLLVKELEGSLASESFVLAFLLEHAPYEAKAGIEQALRVAMSAPGAYTE